MQTSLLLRAVFTLLVLFSHLVHAQEEELTRAGPYSVSYVVNQDGTFVESRKWEMTVLKERALSWAKQTSISYSTSIQKAEILEAYTRKRDGRRIDVRPDNYQISSSTGRNKDAPAYSDNTSLSVIFPDLAVGDTVVFSYRLTASEPLFPGHFSLVESFPKDRYIEAFTLRIDSPSALWVQYHANQMAESFKEEKDGRHVVEWTYKNHQTPKNKRVPYSVFDPDKEIGLYFSTFSNYAQIAEVYGERARPKAAVTERIQKLANEIARDRKDPKEIARVLYEWTATNISYAGNCIGLGAVVPRDISFVLDNKMGDCKDHATVLQALLSAKGIESTQALVNSGATYKLPKIPVVSMVNHVINFIPAFNLYVDSTSETTPFGMLPFGDQDKPVLHVDGYKSDTRTGVSAINANEQIMKATTRIGDDGTANIDMSVALKGTMAVDSRNMFRSLPAEAEKDWIKNAFRSSGLTANGTIIKDDPKALLDRHQYSVKMEVKQMMKQAAGAFYISPPFMTPGPVARFAGGGDPDEDSTEADTGETVCSGGRSIEEYVYELPKRMKVISIPPNLKHTSEFASYEATYKLKGNALTIKRVLDDRTRGNLCKPGYSTAYRKFAAKVLTNLQAQVVYK